MNKMIFGAALVGVACTGCTFPSSSRVVGGRHVGHMSRIEYGTVEKVDVVVVAGRRGPIGTYGGGLVGAAAASGVGHGAGARLAQAGGAVVGAVAGQAVEEVLTRENAQEMVIKMDSGQVVMVTQVAPRGFGVGDRVMVANGAGGTQVLLP